MAIFGVQDYGTPFGAENPSTFFDKNAKGDFPYSGFSSRSGAHNFSGASPYSGFSSYCGSGGLAFLPFKPTLTFPLNFAILQGIVKITWSQAVPTDPCDNDVLYEVQYTRSLSRNNGWRTLSSGTKATFLYFDVSNVAYTEDGGFRVRARNSKGLFSEYSTTVEHFTISNHAPNPVKIVLPGSGQVIDGELTIAWIEAQPKDVDGHAVTYLIEITSEFSSDKGWVTIPGAGSIKDGNTSFIANTFNLPDGTDYAIRVSAVDELGLSSIPSVVGPLEVLHTGGFIIDTIPPTGTLTINDGAVLASGVVVKLAVNAKDDTTGIKDVRFGNDGATCWSDWEPFLPEKFWNLPQTDGVKRVFVQFRDFANNISEECNCEIIERVICAGGNVTDIEVFNDSLYAAFDKNGNLLKYRAIVDSTNHFPESSITSIASLGNYLYVATYDGSESFIYRFDGKQKFLLSLPNEKIVSTLAYNDYLYLGSNSGKIFEYTGSNISTSYVASSGVERIKTDGNLMYVSLSSGGEFLTFNGTTWKTNTT